MSIVRCEYCENTIDQDYDSDHLNECIIDVVDCIIDKNKDSNDKGLTELEDLEKELQDHYQEEAAEYVYKYIRMIRDGDLPKEERGDYEY